MKTKYDVGELVTVRLPVLEISVSKDGTWYLLGIEGLRFGGTTIAIPEGDVSDVDVIPAEDYEREINALKDEIERLRSMYQLEHEKLLKLKSTPHSHNPEHNIFADDWRRP